MITVVTALVSALIGSIFGPVVLENYREWKHDKKWKKPRKDLLRVLLNDDKYRFKSIGKLSRTIGASEDETRTLLIELGARGAKMKSGREAWALISRAPLSESNRQIEESGEEE